MRTNDFTLLTPTQYFRDLADRIAPTKAGDRVAVATMSIWSNEPLVQAVIHELEAAAKRGVEVNFTIDAYNFLKTPLALPGPLWPRVTLPRNLREPYRGRLATLERITAAGGHTTITNMPSRPFSPIHQDRSHIKGAVINDTVYIGGCNLTDPVRYDVMARWRSLEMADWVYDAIQSIVRHKGTGDAFGGRDRKLELDTETRLYIDAGIPNQSTILRDAYQLIDEAEDHIFLTCQYFPGGLTAQRLKTAFERGVKVDIYYSHPSAHRLEAPGHQLYALRERLRLPANFFVHRLAASRPLLHAKVLCTEKAAMLGSHNYVPLGVRYGTAEIALQRNSPDFSHKLRAFMMRQINT